MPTTFQATAELLKILGQCRQAECVGWMIVLVAFLRLLMFAVNVFWHVPIVWYRGRLRMLEAQDQVRHRLSSIHPKSG